MKEILRKIEFYENKKFSQTLKQHKDYTRVLLEITRKLLNNNDSIEEVSLSTQSYLKVVINKQSRIFVYLSTDKFYSFEYPCQVEVNKYTKQVLSIYTLQALDALGSLFQMQYLFLMM